MPALYPFLILPEFYERVWGTRDLRPYFSRAVEAEPIGEVWLTGEDCRVANGPLAGQTLRELAAQYGADLTGEAAPQAHALSAAHQVSLSAPEAQCAGASR